MNDEEKVKRAEELVLEIKVAEDALAEAEKMVCTCDSVAIMIDGCSCEKHVAQGAAWRNAKKAKKELEELFS